MTFFGSPAPYMEDEIASVPCARCGKPSSQQWQACANGGYYVGVCIDCDIELNKRTLDFFKIPGRTKMIAEYILKLTDSGR